MNSKKYFIILIGVLIYIFISIDQNRFPIEELNIISGIGYDVDKNNEDNIMYSIPLSVNVYKPSGEQQPAVIKGQGRSLGEVIQNRQEKMNKKFIQGQEQVILISEEYATLGLETLVEDRFRNSEVSDMAYVAICKGNSEEFLRYNVKGYYNSSTYISGLIENSSEYSYFTDDYKLVDLFVRIGAEGRSLALPYIEITKEGIELTGMAIFNEDKMVAKVDNQNSKILNFLKNSNAEGLESLQKSAKEYIDFEGKTKKRKVKCFKEGDKYSFIIDITLTGDIVNNQMYPGVLKDTNVKEQLQKDMEESIENKCYDFLKIMQNEYKIDYIELGKEAAATFGRQKKIDWNEVVSNADIKVNVHVKVDRQGRGDY